MAKDDARECPSWVDEFLDDAGSGIDTGQVPAAYSVWAPDDPDEDEDLSDPWEVHFYPSLSEVKGGANDGAVVFPGLNVDLLTIQECMEDIETFELSSGNSVGIGPKTFRGCVLEIQGWYDGHAVCLKIFDKPPGDAKVASVILPNFVHIVPPEEQGGSR
jgi:hypothetical protein